MQSFKLEKEREKNKQKQRTKIQTCELLNKLKIEMKNNN